jgi:hypothetical protein
VFRKNRANCDCSCGKDIQATSHSTHRVKTAAARGSGVPERVEACWAPGA